MLLGLIILWTSL